MPSDPENFFTTRWTRVARSRGDSEEARAALSDLCESYYQPVQTFIGVTVRDPETAKDLTQAFFAKV
ncbi:MAG: sigma-70 family RNA polymerase sigma factor, partial [Verrucomicrobiota bacterium]